MSEYKNSQPRASTPYSSGVEFEHEAERDNSWHKEAVFHHCKKKDTFIPTYTCSTRTRTITRKNILLHLYPLIRPLSWLLKTRTPRKPNFPKQHQKTGQPLNQSPSFTMREKILVYSNLVSIWSSSPKTLKISLILYSWTTIPQSIYFSIASCYSVCGNMRSPWPSMETADHWLPTPRHT